MWPRRLPSRCRTQGGRCKWPPEQPPSSTCVPLRATPCACESRAVVVQLDITALSTNRHAVCRCLVRLPLQVLLHHKASTSAKDRHGNTAWDYARRDGKIRPTLVARLEVGVAWRALVPCAWRVQEGGENERTREREKERKI